MTTATSLLDMLKKKQAESAAKRGRDKAEKLPPGNSRWRILPHSSGDPDKLPTQDFGQHFIKDFSGQVVAVYLCLGKTYGRDCPICNAINEAKKMSSDPNVLAKLDEARSAQRYLVNAVRRNEKGEYDREVKLLELSGSAVDQLFAAATNFLQSDGINIFDLKAGHDVTFTREGTGLQTRYNCVPSPRPSELPASLMAQARNLEEYVAQEHDEGKNRALSAIKSLSGSTTPLSPMLPPPVTGSRTVAVAGAAAPAAAAAVTAADLDLSDIDLEGLESVDIE